MYQTILKLNFWLIIILFVDFSISKSDSGSGSDEIIIDGKPGKRGLCFYRKISVCFSQLVQKNYSRNLTVILNKCLNQQLPTFGPIKCHGPDCKNKCRPQGHEILNPLVNLTMLIDGVDQDGYPILLATWEPLPEISLYLVQHDEGVSETSDKKKLEILTTNHYHRFPIPKVCRPWSLRVAALVNDSMSKFSEPVEFPIDVESNLNITVDPWLHRRSENEAMMEFRVNKTFDVFPPRWKSKLEYNMIYITRFLSMTDELYLLLNDHASNFNPGTPSFVDDVPDLIINSGCHRYAVHIGSLTSLTKSFCGTRTTINKTIIMDLPYNQHSNSCDSFLQTWTNHGAVILLAKIDTILGEIQVHDIAVSSINKTNFTLDSGILAKRAPKFVLKFRQEESLSLRDGPPRPPPPNGRGSSALVYTISVIIIILIIILAILYFLKRRLGLTVHLKTSSTGESTNEIMTCFGDQWEIARSQLLLDEKSKLGSGEFGAVYKAELVKSASNAQGGQLLTVAVKTLSMITTSMAKENFLEEISLMKRLGRHCHLVNMIGCITMDEPYYLIVEYCPGGDLHHYLREKRTYMVEKQSVVDAAVDESFLSIEMLLTFAWQVACGMEYMSEKQFIHRDLAARNVLLFDNNNNIKIGDFGLSRHFQPENFYYTSQGGRLPIKWMALESLTDYKFTSASDMWSFGVLLFELITLGDGPYPDIDPHCMETYLKTGRRMQKPDNCPDELYDMMKSTWKSEPQERPNFTEIKESIRDMIENLRGADYDYLVLLNKGTLYSNLI